MNGEFDQMLELVAQAYNTNPSAFRNQIAKAVTEGQNNPDPQARALWNSIPRSGEILTVEDFVEYLAQTLPRPYGAEDEKPLHI